MKRRTTRQEQLEFLDDCVAFDQPTGFIREVFADLYDAESELVKLRATLEEIQRKLQDERLDHMTAYSQLVEETLPAIEAKLAFAIESLERCRREHDSDCGVHFDDRCECGQPSFNAWLNLVLTKLKETL